MNQEQKLNLESLQELCSIAISKNVKKRSDIKHLGIPEPLAAHIFRIWKWHQMDSDDIDQCLQEFQEKLKNCYHSKNFITITFYSTEAIPFIPGRQYHNSSKYSYCYKCTKELNLPCEEVKSLGDYFRLSAVESVVGNCYKSDGYCDNCMLPLYEIKLCPKCTYNMYDDDWDMNFLYGDGDESDFCYNNASSD